jgi:hypothetical protein
MTFLFVHRCPHDKDGCPRGSGAGALVAVPPEIAGDFFRGLVIILNQQQMRYR